MHLSTYQEIESRAKRIKYLLSSRFINRRIYYKWSSPRPGTWVVWGLSGRMSHGQIWSRADVHGYWWIACEDQTFKKLHYKRFYMLRHECRYGEIGYRPKEDGK